MPPQQNPVASPSAQAVAALERGATVLTANARLARLVQLNYARAQRANGRGGWPTAPVFTWPDWLTRLWHADSRRELLLTDLQEKTVWIRMQRDDAGLVVSPAALAELAQRAYALLSEHEAHLSRREEWQQYDAERFRHWAAGFDAECRRRGWLSRSLLVHKLIESTSQLPRELLLVGFETPTPAQNTMLDHCIRAGTVVRHAEPVRVSRDQFLYPAQDGNNELRACAAWCGKLLASNPSARIAVIATGQAAQRPAMERVFRRVLTPEASCPPFEFSLGLPLAETPVVKAALLALRWMERPLSEARVSWLLQSGLLSAGAQERLPLASREAQLRGRRFRLDPGLPLLSFASGEGAFARRVQAWQTQAEANGIATRRHPWSTWIDLAPMLLETLGWPGYRPADSLQHQAERRLERMFDELAQLDFDGSTVNFSEFLGALEVEAAAQIFAPESRNAPVQIMGALEAAGQQFDGLWVLGADDAAWPLQHNPHPLLPAEVQREYDMPHASRAQDRDFYHALSKRLTASAPAIVLSYVALDADGNSKRLSPVWTQLLEQLQPLDISAAAPQAQAELITLWDASEGIAWPVDAAAGGSEVIARQAACAFQAFAARRLRAEPLRNASFGLSEANRGTLLHRVLEQLWTIKSGEANRLHSLEDLERAIAEESLAPMVHGHVEEVFAAAFPLERDAWTTAYLASEKQRLERRLLQWLTKAEASRVAFRVAAVEHRLENVDVAGLRLNLRVDRMDVLEDEGVLLLDYKTGAVSPSMWKGDRPEEPQLPLYAAFGGVPDLRGVLFAEIRPGRMCFTGRVRDGRNELCAETSSASGMAREPLSDTQLEQWTATIERLASDFRCGAASVAPVDRGTTCSRCGLQALCRVAELDPRGTADAERESGDE